MTIIDAELQRLDYDIRRVSQQLGRLHNAHGTCPVSNCRRERQCIGSRTPCLFPKPITELNLPPARVAEWNALLLERRELVRRFREHAAAIGVTAAG